ncbi:MAG TPA: cobalamin B12-binding domain-containing protein [Ignavibacteria bacterium]|nr:cobalamin B12-binding domain-containing protein [Ignavibacteria bacterium]
MENSSNERKIRILIGKVGLDGHDRGAKVIAAAFRDAGIEVIYAGLRQTPESMVEAALQEDVDAIGISILSGAHMTIFPKVKSLMNEKGMEDVLLFGGGIMPESDISELKKIGVGELFTPGTPTFETVEYVRNWVASRRRDKATA